MKYERKVATLIIEMQNFIDELIANKFPASIIYSMEEVLDEMNHWYDINI